MERGLKYRIYPNASQRDQIARTLGCCRFVYNRALDVKKSAYRDGQDGLVGGALPNAPGVEARL